MRAKGRVLLEQLQADDDSFLASIPTTAFIVLSLASVGRRDHKIVQRGVEFLLSTVRGDASWPVKTSIATTATTLALNGLANAHRPTDAAWHDSATIADTESNGQHVVASSHDHPPFVLGREDELFSDQCLDWLLATQRTTRNTVTDVAPGGWSCSDAAGELPNSNDTAGVLIALARWPQRRNPARRDKIYRAAQLGLAWLLDLQSQDGGWPTFYRRTGGLLLDPSGPDATSHALRALDAWQKSWHADATDGLPTPSSALSQRLDAAIQRGWRYLETAQHEDGRFVPLWFGNEFQPDDQNPVIGTAQVLLMSHALSRSEWEMASRAARWLLTSQHAGGGWGPPRAPIDYSGAEKDGFRAWRENESMAKLSSVEETALAVAALLPLAAKSQPVAKAASAGLNWLANAIEQDAHRRPSAIGYYPSRIWYHERLYPLAFAQAAMSQALHALATERPATTHVG
jgi:squalene-hopene/tetraprenyl-beta-curcumene cyclase